MSRKTRRRRRKPRFQRQTKPGASPGTIKVRPGSAHPKIRVLAYGPERIVEERVERVGQIPGFLQEHPVTWVDVTGLGDEATIRELGDVFHVHSLALEDVVHVHQRAKVEVFQEQLFVVARIVRSTEQVETEQLSLFLGGNYVLTFRERETACLEPVRERIRLAGGRLRQAGADYLAYALLDAVIDSYFPVVERLADHVEALDDVVDAHFGPHISDRVRDVRHELLLLRRAMRPHREAINQLVRDAHPLIGDETRIFLRDCYDHTVQLIDLLDVYREMCSDIREHYQSAISNRMNEVMKVLTIIATIFIPLGFIAGVYGMNFNPALPGNMPELDWPYGYLFALCLMLLSAGGMVLYFWRKGWIGSGEPSNDKVSREDPAWRDGVE